MPRDTAPPPSLDALLAQLPRQTREGIEAPLRATLGALGDFNPPLAGRRPEADRADGYAAERLEWAMAELAGALDDVLDDAGMAEGGCGLGDPALVQDGRDAFRREAAGRSLPAAGGGAFAFGQAGRA